VLQIRDDAAELMESDFALGLNPQLLTYLNTANSVPAFLASVTMDMYESQTFMG
jgi:hypothetical protein